MGRRNCLSFMILVWALLAATPGLTDQAELTPVSPVVAPPFDLAAVNDAPGSLAAYKGKVLVVNFWATWCPPCRAEMPALQRLWERTRSQGVEVLGIAVAEEPAMVTSFAQNFGLEFPLLIDADGTTSQAWRARGLPTTYILDSEQRIRYRAVGERVWDSPEIIEAVLQLNSR